LAVLLAGGAVFIFHRPRKENLMLRLLSLMAVVLVVTAVTSNTMWADDKGGKVPAALNFKMENLAGEQVDLSKYKGKVVLMVNVASKCGYTPQYAALEALHEKYGDQGLAILGFPANEFGKQEPGTNQEISEFCTSKYGVKFDMFAKTVVKGQGQCPLYQFLTSKETDPKFAGPIGWNFEKFLINRDGEVVARFKSGIKPDSNVVIAKIEEELNKK
jgi:glutathione peroxidase